MGLIQYSTRLVLILHGQVLFGIKSSCLGEPSNKSYTNICSIIIRSRSSRIRCRSKSVSNYRHNNLSLSSLYAPTNLKSDFSIIKLRAFPFQYRPTLLSSNSTSILFKTFASNMASEVDVKEIRLPFHTGSSKHAAYPDQIHDIESTPDFNKVIKTTSECLLNGGVMGVPTDTIYGIAGLAQNNNAVNRIYDIKQRNYSKPLAISVGRIDDIYRCGKVTVPRQLLSDLLPGPVTVVFERSPELNPELNPQTSLVGIRIPDHIFMKNLAIACNSPIALTSANVSGDKSCLQIEEFKHLWPLLDLVVNGGNLNDSEESRMGSTVVDLSVEGTYRIIRPGSAHAATCTVLQDKYKLKEVSHETASR